MCIKLNRQQRTAALHPEKKNPFVILLRLISYVEIYCSISCVSGALPTLSGSNSSCSTTEKQVLTGSRCAGFEADVPGGGRNPHLWWLRSFIYDARPSCWSEFYLTTMAFDLRVRWLGRLPAPYRVFHSYYSQRAKRSHRMLISCCQPVLNYQCAWKINFQTSFILSESENNLFLSR